MRRKKWLFVVVLLLVLAAWSGYKLYLQRQAAEVYTGTVEVTKADIMPKRSGYLEVLSIEEGDSVAAGQQVARLDQKSFDAQLRRDAAALAGAEAKLADLRKGARPEELREAAANTASALSVYDKARADRLRFAALYTDGAVSRQQFDEALSADVVAENALKAAREKEKLLLAGNRVDVIAAQEMEVERLAAVLEETRIAAAECKLYSPLSGLVLTKQYETGEYIGAGGALATVADLGDCWVKIYVSSDVLGTIQVGQSVTVQIDAYPDRPFAGRVKEISDTAEYTPRQSITKNERANLVFAVKVAIPNADGIFKPGMVADVTLP